MAFGLALILGGLIALAAYTTYSAYWLASLPLPCCQTVLPKTSSFGVTLNSFGRGTRQCVGMRLAYAAIYFRVVTITCWVL